jgi:cell division protein ZapA (FtsZ GTPase activity inhibitor)
MAALNIAHELLVARDAAPHAANAQDASGGFDMEDAKRRMQSMQATLENALAPQETLFK